MTKSSPIDLVKSYEDFHKHDAARILKIRDFLVMNR